MNYIKGYRYEIYCISRTQRTPHCTVWVRAEDEVSDQWNVSREPEHCLTQSLLQELRLRYEAPSEKNRWDCPLFIVNR